ncbi:uncharacterized protein LOC142972374 [Anticarsia gemmatalis]|uniref:uncharacterized protein LOC142972374 n=1 Tax=Anticarsia gemmatalis TaxID=129554 RepID=UPI003F7673BB
MLTSLKKLLKWKPSKSPEPCKNQTSLLLAAFIGILEDVLFWKKMWFSLSFMFFFNVIFFVCVHRQINLLEFLLCISIAMLAIDAFESWLKHKHRTTFLKRLASHEGDKLNSVAVHLNQYLHKKWIDYLFLRETNHTKAFLLININLMIIFIIGKYVNGYVLTYLLLMLTCVFYKLILPILRTFKNIKQDLESDYELEGLIPDISDVDIKLLSIEPEQAPVPDEKQSFDYWKPEDVPLAECSDSSDNSSSLVTNFSMEKMQTLEKDVDTSDTSEDEYIPLDQHKEPKELQSTMEVVEPANTWSSAAYNTFWNITGAVANMMQTESAESKRKRLSSIDSSDGFEMIDKNDLT